MNLTTALGRELRGGFTTITVREGQPQLRGTRLVERQQLAEYLSGTTNRKSQKYRSAMRNIQRWAKGRKVSKPSLLGKLRRIRVRAHPYGQGANVEIDGEIYDRPRTIRAHVSSELMDTVTGLWYAGNREAAAEAFEAGVFDSYGAPQLFVTDVSELNIEPA